MQTLSTRLLVQAAMLATLGFSGMAHADLAGSVQDVQKTQLQLIKDAAIETKNAASCGFIGGQIASAMKDVVTGLKKDLSDFNLAVAKGKAGISTIQAQADANTKSNTQMESNLSMARYGLSTNSPTCKAALAAFENMRTLSLQMPNKLDAIIALIQTSN